jgi:sugar O-acyltransferase (sialic acid O-acetyltransferase NeuD family)
VRYLVIGAAGHAQEVAWSLREQLHGAGGGGELRFFDDRVPRGPLPSGLGHVVGTIDQVPEHASADEVALVLGVGLPRTKVALVERLAPLGLPWATVIHPRATIGPNVTLGEGTYVAAGAIITVNVRVGRFVTVNMHCQVAHDDVVEEFATLHPDVHLAGNVTIGTGCALGTGSIVIPEVSVGEWATLGAGCVVIANVAGGIVYVGAPARAARSRDGHELRRTLTRVPV